MGFLFEIKRVRAVEVHPPAASGYCSTLQFVSVLLRSRAHRTTIQVNDRDFKAVYDLHRFGNICIEGDALRGILLPQMARTPHDCARRLSS